MNKYNHELAKRICNEMGITWNPDLTGPTVGGVPVSEDMEHHWWRS